MGEVTVRRSEPDELDRIIDLAGGALGWDPDAPNEAFFRWKHLDNPFGASPMWVAEVDGDLAGFRTFLRWQFSRGDGSNLSGCRAVDTATVAEHRGKGVFSALTRAAVDELTEEGIDFVFNTPNDQSRPGYLKMGWVDAGLVDMGIRPRLRSLSRLAGARKPADKWGLATDVGTTVSEILDGLPDTADLCPTATGHLQTNRTVGFLRWRYGFEPLHYRVLSPTSDPADGFACFRRRRRGSAVETTLCDVISKADSARRPLLDALRHGLRSDYAIATRATAGITDGYIPAPGLGPRLTLRDLASPAPSPDELQLTLGDIELF